MSFCLSNRVSAQADAWMKTEDTENMNNPVSKTRLIEMYNHLKLLCWPKIKDHLKSNKLKPEFTKALIQVP